MTVSDEIVLSMTAIMTAFARGENRSMLNQPFPNGKASVGAARRCAALCRLWPRRAFPFRKTRAGAARP
ncbi:TPA: hypothetical protein ACKE3D_004699, partial [Burkholderia dolosa]